MGRTLGTAVQILQAEEAAWQAFRRALRKEDHELFDRLWRYARFHAVPFSMANRPVPYEAILMAMLVGLMHEVDELRTRSGENRPTNTAANKSGSDRSTLKDDNRSPPLQSAEAQVGRRSSAV